MFRILSLDGGGIKGAFTASVLNTLANDSGVSIKNSFDLIVGTSTGGILAIGIAMGLEPEELLKLYVDDGPEIFPVTGKIGKYRRSLRQLFSSKLSTAPLRKALEKSLSDKKLKDAFTRLVIPTYDAVEGRIYLFKTAHNEEIHNDAHLTAVDVAIATSAAPTYFRAAGIKDQLGSKYVDGGVWANNPGMIGIIEAVAFLKQDITDIRVLSIGTTNAPFNIAQHTNSGVAKWNVGLLSLMMEGQAEAAEAQASLLLGDRYHRIDVTAREGEFSLDDGDPDTIGKLVQLGRGEAQKRNNRTRVKEMFLNGIAIKPFECAK